MKSVFGVCLALMVSFGVYGSDITKEVESFSKVSFTGDFKVHLKEGNKEEVQILNRDEELKDENIIVTVKDGLLKVYVKADLYLDEYDLDIYVTYKNITDIKAKMDCHIEVESTLGGDFVKLSGETSGKIKANIKATEIEVIAGSGCSIDIEGSADRAVLKSNLGGTVAAVDLKVKDVEASVKAGGDVICYATEKLAIDIASGGTVTYKGSPDEYEESIFLGGKIKKMGDKKIEPANE